MQSRRIPDWWEDEVEEEEEESAWEQYTNQDVIALILDQLVEAEDWTGLRSFCSANRSAREICKTALPTVYIPLLRGQVPEGGPRPTYLQLASEKTREGDTMRCTIKSLAVLRATEQAISGIFKWGSIDLFYDREGKTFTKRFDDLETVVADEVLKLNSLPTVALIDFIASASESTILQEWLVDRGFDNSVRLLQGVDKRPDNIVNAAIHAGQQGYVGLLKGMPPPIPGLNYTAIPLGLGLFAWQWAETQYPEYWEDTAREEFYGVGAYQGVPSEWNKTLEENMQSTSAQAVIDSEIDRNLKWAASRIPFQTRVCNPDIRSIAEIPGATVLIAATNYFRAVDGVAWVPLLLIPSDDKFWSEAVNALDAKREERVALYNPNWNPFAN